MFHGTLGDPSKSEDERQTNIRKASKVMLEEKNPCIKEHDQSFKCLNDNNFKRDTCAGYFENYKRCKEFWNEVRVSRRREGIVPHLPPAQEREQIKREHMAKLKTGSY